MHPSSPCCEPTTRSSALGTSGTTNASKRYVHCPYYIPETSPLIAVGPRDSGLQAARPGRVGSLGTPRMSAVWGPNTGVHSRTGSYASVSSTTASLSRTSGYNSLQAPMALSHSAELDKVVLLPTRPLLKALAKQCRPSPPWYVGYGVPSCLADEILRYHRFTSATPEEETAFRACVERVEMVLRQVWPDATLHSAGATAAGQNVMKGSTLRFYASGTTSAGISNVEQQWTATANAYGMQVTFVTDDRELPCAVLMDSSSGHRCCVVYGDGAAAALAETSELLSRSVAAHSVACAVFNTLLALLSQNKMLDENGTTRTMLSGEAVAIMLLAVLNSYDASDVPDAGRVLLDFFLTYGFESYFNPMTTSVSVAGFEAPIPKRHPNAQLSVLDPVNMEVNITPHVERVSSIQAVFNYCYTALSQYAQVSSNAHRAQSALSTILGGEPYWVRVLRYYQLGVEPYHGVIQSKKPLLAQFL